LRQKPIEIRLAGYGPPSTSFSQALKRVGDRLEATHGAAIEVRYVWNIMDLGYKAEDILWLVECGVLTLGYQSTSYFTARVPDLAILDLPFLFPDNATARAAMDGTIGAIFRTKIEQAMDYRILGYFENGFRHVSNRVRAIRTPADLKGLRIRVLPSEIQARTFELLGAEPKIMDLTEARAGIADGTLDAQENPFANTTTYGVHNYHKHHTLTAHSYLSRPIFVHRPTFASWPQDVQHTMSTAVNEAVALQRSLGEQEARSARSAIEAEGGNIVELTPAQVRAFVETVEPLFEEAATKYDRSVMNMLAHIRRRETGSST
jgi:TRAP-type C4-dicarboxylate transport system substrate-binding protein